MLEGGRSTFVGHSWRAFSISSWHCSLPQSSAVPLFFHDRRQFQQNANARPLSRAHCEQLIRRPVLFSRMIQAAHCRYEKRLAPFPFRVRDSNTVFRTGLVTRHEDIRVLPGTHVNK
jgi:hypothetical protein